MTQTATIGRSNVHHAATANGSVACGAVHSRSTRRGTVTLHKGGEVTCTKCRKAAPVAAPVAAPAEPLTFMQRQRLAGKAR